MVGVEVFLLHSILSPRNKVGKGKGYFEPINPLEPGDTNFLQSLIFQVLAFYHDYTYCLYQ